MRKLPALLLLSVSTALPLSLSAQKSFGNLIVGLESGFDVAQFTEGMKARMSPAIQAEVSLGRVSLGGGVGLKYYPDYEFYSFTGETVQREVNGAALTFYVADLHVFRPRYFTVPLKINVRVHRCDCVYLHAGVIFNKFDTRVADKIRFEGAEFDQPFNNGLYINQLMRPRTTTYEFGVGFNVFRRDFFRLVARPTYAISENPEVYGNAPKWLPTLRFTFGAQFSIWKNND